VSFCVNVLWLTNSPRVILVSQEGRLVGLVTVKDVLRHEAFTHHHRSATPKTPTSAGHSREDSSSSWNGWNESWHDQEHATGAETGGIRGNGLEYALEAALSWARTRAASLRGLDRRRTGETTAYDYELSEDRPA
jgi:chloride channel 3/4/5